MITIYKKKNCPQCTMTAREMDRLGISYDTIDLDSDTDALDYVQSLGYRSAPVVVTTTDHWSGFRPDKIKQNAPAIGPSPTSALDADAAE